MAGTTGDSVDGDALVGAAVAMVGIGATVGTNVAVVLFGRVAVVSFETGLVVGTGSSMTTLGGCRAKNVVGAIVGETVGAATASGVNVI